MIKMSENRVDPTVAGLFLVGLTTLLFGLIGLLMYNGSASGFGLLTFTIILLMPLALVFLVFTVSAIRCGNAFAASLFGFVGIALFGAAAGLILGLSGAPIELAFYILGVFFILFALVAFMIGAPKLLAILLLLVALVYIFVGLFFAEGTDTFALLFGIFGILAGAVATYMAIALSTEKLPVF